MDCGEPLLATAPNAPPRWHGRLDEQTGLWTTLPLAQHMWVDVSPIPCPETKVQHARYDATRLECCADPHAAPVDHEQDNMSEISGDGPLNQ